MSQFKSSNSIKNVVTDENTKISKYILGILTKNNSIFDIRSVREDSGLIGFKIINIETGAFVMVSEWEKQDVLNGKISEVIIERFMQILDMESVKKSELQEEWTLINYHDCKYSELYIQFIQKICFGRVSFTSGHLGFLFPREFPVGIVYENVLKQIKDFIELTPKDNLEDLYEGDLKNLIDDYLSSFVSYVKAFQIVNDKYLKNIRDITESIENRVNKNSNEEIDHLIIKVMEQSLMYNSNVLKNFLKYEPFQGDNRIESKLLDCDLNSNFDFDSVTLLIVAPNYTEYAEKEIPDVILKTQDQSIIIKSKTNIGSWYRCYKFFV